MPHQPLRQVNARPVSLSHNPCMARDHCQRIDEARRRLNEVAAQVEQIIQRQEQVLSRNRQIIDWVKDYDRGDRSRRGN